MTGSRGTFCPFEIDYFPASEFRVIGGTKVHVVDPAHRAMDGLRVSIDNEVVIPAAEDIAAPETYTAAVSSAILSDKPEAVVELVFPPNSVEEA